MNDHLRYLLRYTPSIVSRKNQDIICETIDPSNWKAALRITHNVEVGKWVRVTRGTYKGDVGCVSRFETSGEVAVLLVPRLTSPSELEGQSTSNKRKRSNPPPDAELFIPNVPKDTPGIPLPSDVGRDVIPLKEFVHDGKHFEYGLLVKLYDMHSITTVAVSMPSKTLSRFRFSDHPLILASIIPKPLEWIFEEGEKVSIASSGKLGTIHIVVADGVEVELDSGEGIVKVSWLDVDKFFTVGDYVEVLSGEHKGKTGWIETREHLYKSKIILVSILEDEPSHSKVKEAPITFYG